MRRCTSSTARPSVAPRSNTYLLISSGLDSSGNQLGIVRTPIGGFCKHASSYSLTHFTEKSPRWWIGQYGIWTTYNPRRL